MALGFRIWGAEFGSMFEYSATFADLYIWYIGQYLVTPPFASMMAGWTMEQSLTQHVEALGSALGIILFLFQHLFFPFFFNFSQTNKGRGDLQLRSKGSHWNYLSGRHNFLRFHCGKLTKIRSKSCYSDSIGYFFFINCKVRFFILPLRLNVSPEPK